MFHINNLTCDAIWFPASNGGQMGIIKALDPYNHETKWYVGWAKGEDEARDVKRILERGTKYTGEEIESLKKWFTPYEKKDVMGN